jgi:hypothetical protein
MPSLDSPQRAVLPPGADRPGPRSAAGSGAKRLVAERLRARKRRIRVIRRRVVGLATALFLASSGGIFVQLVTGNDPALAKAAAAKTASVTSKSSGSGSTSGSSTSGASSGSSSPGTTTAVTTSSS